MTKVLSTKLKVDEIDQFTAMAEQRGESKAGLLKSIVLDYMNASSKVDPKKSTSIPHSGVPLKDDILPDKTNHIHKLSLPTSPSSCNPCQVEAYPAKIQSPYMAWSRIVHLNI